MSILQMAIQKNYIRPNLLTAILELNKLAAERQRVTPNFDYYAVGGVAAILQNRQRATLDLDVRVSLLGPTEKLAMQSYPNWQVWLNEKKPHQIKAFVHIDDDRVKVDAVLVPPSDQSIFSQHKLITTIEGINVANVALLAIIKLETLAVRGNNNKLLGDYRDLLWCLSEVKRLGLVIPPEALSAGFPSGWTKMYTRLQKVVDPFEVMELSRHLRLTNLLFLTTNYPISRVRVR